MPFGRVMFGDMELNATLTSRDIINKRMRELIEEPSIRWGAQPAARNCLRSLPVHSQ